MEAVKERVKEHEGRKNKVYRDSEGYLTVGIGYKLPKNSPLKEHDYVDDAFVDSKFEETFTEAAKGAKRLLKDTAIRPEAFGVLTEMVFQMGTTQMSGWTNTINYLKKGEYKKASEEILKGKTEGTVSKWSLQTPNRAYALSKILADLEDNK